MKIFSTNIFYDYIRIVKPATIRNLKNISALIALVGLIITLLIIIQPKARVNAGKPVPSENYPDKKTQIDQAKKNSILRRFISYYQVKAETK